MQALYGKRWIEEYGPEPHPAWVVDLQSMTPSEAAMGWKACKDAGEQERHVPTLPVFLARVKTALKAQKQRTETYKALPPIETSSPMVLDAWNRGKAEAGKAREDVDVARLERALGRKGVVKVQQMRRVVLRGIIHPAGGFDLGDLRKAKGACKQAGRSWQDMELELMAHNGWTPGDEDQRQADLAKLGRAEPMDAGARPFLAAWEAGA